MLSFERCCYIGAVAVFGLFVFVRRRVRVRVRVKEVVVARLLQLRHAVAVELVGAAAAGAHSETSLGK